MFRNIFRVPPESQLAGLHKKHSDPKNGIFEKFCRLGKEKSVTAQGTCLFLHIFAVVVFCRVFFGNCFAYLTFFLTILYKLGLPSL